MQKGTMLFRMVVVVQDSVTFKFVFFLVWVGRGGGEQDYKSVNRLGVIVM